MDWVDSIGSIVSTGTNAYKEITMTKAESDAIKKNNSSLGNLNETIATKIESTSWQKYLFIGVGALVGVVVLVSLLKKKRRK